MTDVEVIQLVSGAFMVAAKIGGPILMAALVIGVVIGVLQTLTQIQEMTLTFVPKLVAAGLIIVWGGPWMIRETVGWVRMLWSLIPGMT